MELLKLLFLVAVLLAAVHCYPMEDDRQITVGDKILVSE